MGCPTKPAAVLFSSGTLRYGLLTRLTGLFGAPAAAVTLPVRGSGPDVYQRLGVEPFINCTSTYTINGGSRQLPEVIAAVEKASHYHVNIDELMAKAGPRLAELLGGPAAMVSSGAAGAVTCGAAACVAGGDPEKMQKLPDTSGMKSECVVPKWSRSYYDHAVRAVGVKMIEVGTLAELERALGPRTALAHGQANMLAGSNPFTLRQYVESCHRHRVPVLIDAAADLPLKPNPYLAAGVDLVAYSGGKILRGPQTSGILLGRADTGGVDADPETHHDEGEARGGQEGGRHQHGRLREPSQPVSSRFVVIPAAPPAQIATCPNTPAITVAATTTPGKVHRRAVHDFAETSATAAARSDSTNALIPTTQRHGSGWSTISTAGMSWPIAFPHHRRQSSTGVTRASLWTSAGTSGQQRVRSPVVKPPSRNAVKSGAPGNR